MVLVPIKTRAIVDVTVGAFSIHRESPMRLERLVFVHVRWSCCFSGGTYDTAGLGASEDSRLEGRR